MDDEFVYPLYYDKQNYPADYNHCWKNWTLLIDEKLNNDLM